MYHTPTETRVARKDHRCTSCGEPILKGHEYKRWCSYDNAAYTSKMHPECFAYHMEDAEYGEFEYMPYSHERPRRDSNDTAKQEGE